MQLLHNGEIYTSRRFIWNFNDETTQIKFIHQTFKLHSENLHDHYVGIEFSELWFILRNQPGWHDYRRSSMRGDPDEDCDHLPLRKWREQ